ncbi:MAG: polysaccharide biosynthesis C-terminal domain-containing protein [Candidatus Altiarchaeota archaeon]|nr:polysaccharide biosynthesis C-terminal domain-containing protein [Candidatus Altiarchaeota archaeon]
MKRIFGDKLYGNATYLMVTSVVTSGLGFFFWTIVAGFYSVGEVGLASTIITSMMLLAALSTLGFDLGLVRFLPQLGKEKSDKLINSCLTLSGIFAILLPIIFLIGLRFWAPKLIPILWGNILFTFFFILFTFVWLLGMLVDAVFIAKRTAKYIFIRNLVFSVIKLIIPFFVITLGAFGIFFSWGFSALIAFFIVLLYFIPKLGYGLRFFVDRAVIKPVFKFSMGNYVANFLGSSPYFLLPLLITHILSPEITAYFYVSWMIAAILFMIPAAVSSSLLAEVSTNEERFKENLRRGIIFAYLLVIPGVFFIFLLGDRLLLLFGELYRDNALEPLKIFAFSAILYSINIIYVAVNNIKKRVDLVVLVNGITAFITLGVSYLLMESYGLMGIAFAWTLSQIVVILFIVCRHLGDFRRIVSFIISR